ncbi:phage tail protein [Streptomyces sediminimaris]|uniref:phage tail protein n=1 Tax=Streptomyces sediminimaris TaxID=3383721 RepID=UPI00399B5A92
MALTIGTLVGLIRADDSGMRRGLTDAELRMRGLQRDMDGRLRDIRGRFVSESRLMGRSLGDGIGDGGDRAHLSLKRIAGMAGGLAGVAASAGRMAAMLGTAAPAAAGVAAALANIAPAAGVAATGVVGVALAAGAVKIGISGVGDAVKAAFNAKNPQQLAEALKGLAPNARSFVQQLKGMQGQFTALKKQVQNQLFAGLDGVLKRMGQSTLPVIRTGLTGAAGALNQMAKGVGNAAIGLSTSGTLGKAIRSATGGLGNLTHIPGQVVTALGQIAAAAGPSFQRLTQAAGSAFGSLSDKLSDAFSSGKMQKVIENAISLIGDLADVAGNVGSILGSVFSAVQVSGGGFIGTLKTISGALADAFASPAVQGGLKALFSTMSTVAQTAAPLLTQALGVIGPVLEQLGPPVQTLIKALGDALSPIIDALGPVLESAAGAVGTLVTALAPILPIIGDLVAQLLPALTPLLDSVTGWFSQAAPVVLLLAQTLGTALSPILATLPTLVQPIADLIGQLAQTLFPVLSDLVVALAPSLARLGGTISTLAVALAPLIEAVAGLVVQLLQALMPIIEPLIGLVMKLADIFTRVLAAEITNVVIPVIDTIVALLHGDFSGAWSHAKEAVDGAKRLIGKAVTLLGQLVGKGIDTAIGWLKGMPGRALSALSALSGYLRSRALEAGGKLVSAISGKVGDAVSRVRALPGKAKSALGNLGSYLLSAGKSLIQGFINGIKSKLGSVASAAKSVVSAAADFFPHSPAKKGPFSGRGYTLHSGRALIQGFQKGIADRLPGLQSQLQGLGAGMPRGFALAGMPASAVAGGAGAIPGAGAGKRVTNNYNTTYNLEHREMTIQQLDALQRRQDARARVGRPR